MDDKHIRMLAGGGGGGGSGGSKSNHRPKTQPHSGNNPQSVDKSSDVDIVDAQFPRMPDISKGESLDSSTCHIFWGQRRTWSHLSIAIVIER